MKILCSYLGTAYILSRDGTSIEVNNHPSINIPDEIVDFMLEYGSKRDKEIVAKYNESKSEELLNKIIESYNESWCKVRIWGTYGEEVTFRITSTNFNWYNCILEFLLSHPGMKHSKITVENDKRFKSPKIYWEQVNYDYATDTSNEAILSSCFIN